MPNEPQYWVRHRGQGTDKTTLSEPLPQNIELQAVHDGFGWYGVLLTDADGEFVQCHVCGAWRKALEAHVRHRHQMSAEEYKESYELGILGIVSPEYSNRLRVSAHETSLASQVKNPVDLRTIRPENNSLAATLVRSAGAQEPARIAAVSEATKRRLSDKTSIAFLTNKTHLDKVRPNQKGKPKPSGFGAKISQARRGKPISEAHKAKLRKPKSDGQKISMHNARIIAGPKKGGSSQYKGVTRKKGRKTWSAAIVVDGKRYWLGSFESETEAAKAYDDAALVHFGEGAYFNLRKIKPLDEKTLDILADGYSFVLNKRRLRRDD